MQQSVYKKILNEDVNFRIELLAAQKQLLSQSRRIKELEKENKLLSENKLNIWNRDPIKKNNNSSWRPERQRAALPHSLQQSYRVCIMYILQYCVASIFSFIFNL